MLKRSGALPLRPTDPDHVGPYVSLGLLGSGGMGRVYVARPVDGGPELVAVKVIRPEYAEDVRFRRRFEREASVHERVRTPLVPRLCGMGFDDELLWMATEYLPGLDLADAVREGGALGTATVWRLLAELARALADLSAAGIVHRDLKPSNVLLSVRGAHVIDFGISKAADTSAITGTGNRVGTPAYMSPEYLRTGECDTASDVFSLACALVYAATGTAPFGDGTGVDVMHRVAFEEPNPKVISEIATADPALAALLTACLAKEPGQRPTPQVLSEAGGSRARAVGDRAEAVGNWPEPLGGRVLTRQQAYEELCRLPLEELLRARPAGMRQPAVAAGSAHEAAKDANNAQAGDKAQGREAAAPAGSAAPVEGASVEKASLGGASVEEAGQPATAETRTRARHKQVSVVATAVALCAAAAAAYVLTHPSTTAAQPPKAGMATAAEGVPGDTTSASPKGSSGGASGPDSGTSVSKVSGKEGDNDDNGDGNGNGDVDDTDDDVDAAARPDAPTPAPVDEDAPRTEPSTPTPRTDAPSEPSPSPSGSPPESGTPAWISDCAHYSGHKRTKLGQSGKPVLQVQCMLIKRGYSVGDSGVDGYFGEGTEAAVIAFQTDHGLKANGVVRPAVWRMLRSAQ